MFNNLVTVGPSIAHLGEYKLYTSLLDKEYSEVSVLMEEIRQVWIRDGCSIIMDGWIGVRHQPLINVIILYPFGSYFLRAIDCLGKRKGANSQFQIIFTSIHADLGRCLAHLLVAVSTPKEERPQQRSKLAHMKPVSARAQKTFTISCHPNKSLQTSTPLHFHQLFINQFTISCNSSSKHRAKNIKAMSTLV